MEKVGVVEEVPRHVPSSQNMIDAATACLSLHHGVCQQITYGGYFKGTGCRRLSMKCISLLIHTSCWAPQGLGLRKQEPTGEQSHNPAN